MRMLDNVAVHNRQQLDRAVNSFIYQGEFEAMKMPSSHRAARCSKHQFHIKVTYLLQCMYCIAGNFHGRNFVNWWKIRLLQRKLLSIVRSCHKGHHAPKFHREY